MRACVTGFDGRIMSIIHEISAAMQLMIAAVRLRGAATEFDGRQIVSLSTTRVVCFLVVQTARIFIATRLGIGGMRFLSYTINLTEMLLNAVALEECARSQSMCMGALVQR